MVRSHPERGRGRVTPPRFSRRRRTHQRSAVPALRAVHADPAGRKAGAAGPQAGGVRLEDLAALRTAQLQATVAELESEVFGRRRAEASLRESEARFRIVVEASLDGFILLECVRDQAGAAVDMRIVELNRRMELMLQRPRYNLLGRRLLADLPDSTGTRFYPLYLEVATTGRPVQHRVDVPPSRQSAGQYEMQVVKLGDGVAVSLRDVSARVAAEQGRLQLERELQEARRRESIGLLAGGIAHDFNNILTAVLGNAELALLDVPPGSPVAESLAAVVLGVRRAAQLTGQLLAYAGRGRSVVGPVALNQLVDELRDLLRAALPGHCSLRMALAPGLPAVRADAGQLRQLLVNLVANAAEASAEAGGQVSLSTAVATLGRAVLDTLPLGAELAEGTYIELAVADQGEGMDSATMAQLFTPFFSTRGPGRGLGLAAVQGTVRAHRGALRIESAPGRGTTVTVWLPAEGAPGAWLAHEYG